MATTLETYAPFDSGAGSNVSEATWRRFMRHMLGSGVLVGITNQFEAFADSTGMQVKVKSGECWIYGHWGESTSQKTLPIATAHATLGRIDLVVLRADFTNNRIELDVVTGTASGSPVAPSPTQNTVMWEVALATVLVDAAASTIAAAKVTDGRQWAETAPPPPVSDTKDTNGTTTSGAFTATLTGGTACGFAFVAPATGKVLICNTLQVSNSNTSSLALCSYQVRLGSTVGSGTIIVAPANETAMYSGAGIRGAVTRLQTGLTPGVTYNIQHQFAVTSDTGSYSNKHLIVTPA